MKTRLFRMFDWQNEATVEIPGVSVGAYQWHLWEALNPGQGEYNWEPIERGLAKLEGVTLPNGEPKPAMLGIFWSLSEFKSPWLYGYDGTPTWVYARCPSATVYGRKMGFALAYTYEYVENGVTKTKTIYSGIPRYDNASLWQGAVFDFVKAFGARYNGDPRIAAIKICPGLDGETQIHKDASGKPNWFTLCAKQAAGAEYGFGNFVQPLMEAYKDAFPDTPLFINNAPNRGLRPVTWLKGKQIGVGSYHCGMQPDLDSHEGNATKPTDDTPSTGYCGSWQHMGWANEEGLPVGVESAHWGDDQYRYWGMLAGLHYHPTIADLHSGWFLEKDAAWIKFFADHLGVDAKTTPSAWVVFRDAEYPVQKWTGAEISGKRGNWEFFLKVTDGADAPRFYRKEVLGADGQSLAPKADVRSRQFRLVRGAVLEPAADFASSAATFMATFTAINEDGKAFSVIDTKGNVHNVTLGAALGAANVWVEIPIEIAAGTFVVRSDTGVYMHKIELTRAAALPEPEDPPTPPTPPEPQFPPVFLPENDEANADATGLVELQRRAQWYVEHALGTLQSGDVEGAGKVLISLLRMDDRGLLERIFARLKALADNLGR